MVFANVNAAWKEWAVLTGLSLPLSPCSFPNLPHVPDTNTETDLSRPDFLRDIHHFLKKPAACVDEKWERHIWHTIFAIHFFLPVSKVFSSFWGRKFTK